MKVKELLEMAVRGGDLRQMADKYSIDMQSYLQDSDSVGHIDTFDVKRKSKFYSVWDGDSLIALAKVDDYVSYWKVDDLWVSKEYAGKKLLSKLLWFFRSRLNMTHLLLGFIHSDETYSIIKGGGLSKFKRSWYNPLTGEHAEYSPNTVDDFYDIAKQKWSLMLENTDNEYENMPAFRDVNSGYIIHAYDWQIQ